MKVKDLIKELQALPQDAEVVYEALNDNYCAYEQEVLFVSEKKGRVVINDGI